LNLSIKRFNQFLVNVLKSTFTNFFIIGTQYLAAALATLATAASVLATLATNNAIYSLVGVASN
jgi:hypothetical protein